jgi:thioredoxin 1
MELRSVTDDTFAVEVLGADRPVLVDFWAPWCGPCKAMGPVLQQIATEHVDAISVVKLDIDENPVTAGQLRVMSIPSLTLFVAGEAAVTVTGAKSKKAILESLARWL